MTKEYKTITEISGPLIFVEKTEPVGYMELVEIRTGGDLKEDRCWIPLMISWLFRYSREPVVCPRILPSVSPETSSRCHCLPPSWDAFCPDLESPETAALRSYPMY